MGTSAKIACVRRRIEILAPRRCTVVVVGETGTGKGLVARLLHDLSGRRGDSVRVPAAHLAPGLLHSQLFGHIKGAFSGAVADHLGLLAQAEGGTFFFDELQDLPLDAQPLFMDFLDREPFQPLGAERAVQPDARVVVASQRPLEELVAEKKLRADFLHRLGGMEIWMPPLRERREDLEVLIPHFAARTGAQEGVRVPRFCDALLEMLWAYDWPGNVRELAGAVEHVVLMAEGDVAGPETLPRWISVGLEVPGDVGAPARASRDTLAVLRRARGKVAAAARHFGVTPKTVYRDLTKLGLRARDIRREIGAE